MSRCAQGDTCTPEAFHDAFRRYPQLSLLLAACASAGDAEDEDIDACTLLGVTTPDFETTKAGALPVVRWVT